MINGSSLLDYYRKKIDDDTDTVYFQRVKEEDIKICGRPLRDAIQILNGLDLEKEKEMKLTMENLGKWCELISQETRQQQEKALKVLLNKGSESNE